LFGPQDFAPGFASVAVISDGLWRRDFGTDPNVLGRTIRLNNDPLLRNECRCRILRRNIGMADIPSRVIDGAAPSWLGSLVLPEVHAA
jgi:hypothetical protein